MRSSLGNRSRQPNRNKLGFRVESRVRRGHVSAVARRGPTSRTMILLDPDLDPHPTPPKPSAKRASASVSFKLPHQQRMPSARALARFLSDARAAVRLRGKVSVLLTTDTAVKLLNKQFRGKNKATDVLSFPAGGPAASEIAGDLAISVPTARRQAIAQGHGLEVEIKVLMLHGLLHLAGYDHETDSGQMARRERLLRGRLKLTQGLIERVEKTIPGEGSVIKTGRTSKVERP